MGVASGDGSAPNGPLGVILDTITDGVVVVARSGRVRFANRAAGEMFGRDPGQIIGSDFGYPIAADCTTELDVVTRGGQPCVLEMRVVETRWEGRPAYLASLRDVTERKRAEAERHELLRAQTARAEAERALRARDRFLAAAAHELKTPITRVQLAVGRALRRTRRGEVALPDQSEETLRLVDREAKHMSAQIGQLLDLARLENGSFALHPRDIDLCRLIRSVIARARASTGVHRIDLACPDDPIIARIDANVFADVLTRLVANGVRYSAPGTVISVDARSDQQDGCPVIRIAVRDQARYSAEARVVEQLFDEEGHGAGLGLGLLVSRRMVAMFGGRIDVALPEDGGTRLELVLPLGPTGSGVSGGVD